MPDAGRDCIMRALGDDRVMRNTQLGWIDNYYLGGLVMHSLRRAFEILSSVAIICGFVCPAVGQPTLERLDKSIRERTDDGAKPRAETDRPAGYLGLTADDAKDRGRGVRVLAVRAGGPAAAAGLKANDLITAIGGVRVREMSDMAEIMALFPAGDTVAMDIQRDGKQQQVKVTLGQSPAAKEAAKPAVAAPEPRVAKKPADEPPLVLPKEPPDVKPELTPPRPKPLLPAAPPPTVEQLQRRIEQLERRVEQLEKALAEALKKP
jgi:hypothetical protein